jgi:SecD/SecF fusion protein
VFDRVRENVPRMPRAAFSQIVNRSMSEVVTRSLATSFCTLLPVLSLLLFGGETLKDFAFALLVGVASGAYSSIFIASPVLTHWKERESIYRSRRARITREFGFVPAYATAAGGAPVDEEPVPSKRIRNRRGSLITPEEPGQELSSEEFADLVKDLDIEGVGTGGGTRTRRESRRARTAARRAGNGGPPTPHPPTPGQSGRQPAGPAATRPGSPAPPGGTQRGVAPGAPRGSSAPDAPVPEPPASSPRDPTADLEPEDVVMPDRRDSGSPAAGRNKPRKPRNRRHGRSR